MARGEEVRTVALPPVARQALAAWLDERGTAEGPLWEGQRGPLSISGITQVVLAVGADAGLTGLQPHRLCESGVDLAQIQAPMGHSSQETSARYFRAGATEQAEVVERIFT
ncbi:hypothetical protein [Nonomuraea typhae]|uniref:Tyr recombinase domain-containing protein n=1 Tax=Nonomuraea typhae TaxID=2603600 RepID=A0ABW7ZDF4_9ACTN